MTDRDTMLRALFAPARALEPREGEITTVLERIRRPGTRRPGGVRQSQVRRAIAPALAALALLATGAYAVPVTRAALEDAAGEITSVFDAWTGSDPAEAPGRALRADEQAPGYFYDGAWARAHVREPRVLAEAGGYKLFAYRQSDGAISFDLGDTGIGMGGFRPAEFRRHALYLLGPGAMPGPDEHGHIPWFGLAARAVTRVEVVYETGPPLRLEHVDGAYVLLVEPARVPRELIAYDSAGKVIGREPFWYPN